MVYENILKQCKEQGISIMQLEKECEIGNGTIGGWRNGNPRLDTLKKVADRFHVTVDELMKGGE